jgi:hypothetical protein
MEFGLAWLPNGGGALRSRKFAEPQSWILGSTLRTCLAILAPTGALTLPSSALAAANYHIVSPSIGTVAHIKKDIAYSFNNGRSATRFAFRRVRVLKLGHRLSNGTTMFFAAVTRPTHAHPRVVMIYGTGGYYVGRFPNIFRLGPQRLRHARSVLQGGSVRQVQD